MTEAQFKVGDIAMLNSGGPQMTVCGFKKAGDTFIYACRWFGDDAHPFEAEFNEKTITKVTD